MPISNDSAAHFKSNRRMHGASRFEQPTALLAKKL